jgi:hypothetical protein
LVIRNVFEYIYVSWGVPVSTGTDWLRDSKSALLGMPKTSLKDSPEFQIWLAANPVCQPKEPTEFQTWLAANPASQAKESTEDETWFTKHSASNPASQPNESNKFQT